MASQLRPSKGCFHTIRRVENPARAVTMAAKKVTVEVISDVVCPWCWIGKRSIEAGAKQVGFHDLCLSSASRSFRTVAVPVAMPRGTKLNTALFLVSLRRIVQCWSQDNTG